MHTEAVTFQSAGVRLGGLLTCPATPGRRPGVLLVGGSGPADRHNDGFFDLLRGRLAGAGAAVFAYDKRGAGQSGGTWADATVDTLARDAAAALDVLRFHPRVDPAALRVLGHSEGGWVALRLCAERGLPGPPSRLVLNSCPAVSFLASEVFALTTAGADPDTAADLLGRLAEAARSGQDLSEGLRIFGEHRHESWYPATDAGGAVLTADTWTQLAAWADYDPAPDLTRLRTPTLVVLGADDPLVPVPASAERYERTAAAVGRHQRTLILPGADHRLRAGTEPAPGYLEALIDWCLHR